MHNAYLRAANIDLSVNRLRNFCINGNKMVISKISNVDKCFASRERLGAYGSKKLLAEFPNKAF